MCKKLFFVIVLIILSNIISAQEITGKIIDSKTKEVLPFVNIIYGDFNLGTTSNINGEFSIKSSQTVKWLKISYIGYYSDTININNNKAIDLTIELDPKTYNIEEAVILPGINPAERIINKVIENRDLNNPEKMNSFSFTSYNKMIFTEETETNTIVDTLKINKQDSSLLFEDQHILVIETINEKMFIQPDKYNEKIIASKISGFKDPMLSLIASQVQAFSFYEDSYGILDKMYLNPISKGSTKKYLFILEDTMFNENKDTIFIISYRPRKGKSFDGLKGILHINTNKYAIQSVIAEPLEINRGTRIKIQQNYDLIENKQWFPKELITEIIFESTTDLIAKGTSYIYNIKLNPELNKKDFNNIELNISEDAYKKPDKYWETNRLQPLTEMDKKTYRVIDSISKLYHLDKKLQVLEIILNGNIPLKCFDLPMNKIIDYNSYEGYRLGLGIMTNNKASKYFSIGGYFGYGFKDEAWKYGGDLIFNLHENSESKLHFSYSNDVREKSGYRFFEKPNFTTTEIYRKYMIENMDLIEKYEVSFSFLSLQYLRTNIFFNQSLITPTDKYRFGKSLANSTNEFTFNEIGFQFRYAYNEKYIKTLRTKYPIETNSPIFLGNIIKGVNWLDGEYEYTKYEAKITKSFKTKSCGKTNIALVGGLIDGNIPLSKLYNGHGSYQSFSLEAENSFGTMRMGEFYSDRFFSVFIKHDFGHLLFRNKKFSPKFALVHNYGIGSISNKTSHLTSTPLKSIDKGYYECGLLINNILNQSFLGYGFGIFYRYGPYSYTNTSDNFSYKLSLTIGL